MLVFGFGSASKLEALLSALPRVQKWGSLHAHLPGSDCRSHGYSAQLEAARTSCALPTLLGARPGFEDSRTFPARILDNLAERHMSKRETRRETAEGSKTERERERETDKQTEPGILSGDRGGLGEAPALRTATLN